MPNQCPAYFAAFHGQAGCLPDYTSGPCEFRTRRDLVQWVNAELDAAGYSQRARRQVDLVTLWKWIQRRGGTIGQTSFCISATDPSQRGHIIEFRGMTREEFNTMEKESEYV